jgi:hypothetical protein
MALTEAQIHAAADQLVAAGKSPTLAAVRAAIGGGSFTTISEVLKRWRASRQTPATSSEPAPPPVLQAAEGLAATVWQRALETAQGRLEAEREALASERQELEASRAEAAELADQLAAEVETQRGEMERLRAEVERQAAALASAEAVAVEQRAGAAELRIRLEERTAERDRLLREKKEGEDARRELERAGATAAAKIDQLVRELAERKASSAMDSNVRC